MKYLLSVFIMLTATIGYAQRNGATEEVMRRVADNVIRSTTFKFVDQRSKEKYDNTIGLASGAEVRAESGYNRWGYPNGVLSIGLMQMAKVLDDKKYSDYAQHNFSFIFDNLPYFEKSYSKAITEITPRARMQRTEYAAVFAMGSLDNTGAMSAGLWDVDMVANRKDYQVYLNKSIDYISHKQLRLKDGTLARSEPRNATIWADDMFMSIPFLARMGKSTGEPKYTNDAIKQVEQFTKYLYDNTSGLYWHCYYTDIAKNGVAHWARCNGWVAMAQVELIKNLPLNHPKRNSLIKLLENQIIGFSRFQDSSGLWHQLLDKSDSYLETSATAMFVYTVATAVNEGWIHPRYIGIARDGWKALQSRVTPDGQLKDVCVGTGIEENISFYYSRPTPLNDTHGLGPFLMAGSEMLRYEQVSGKTNAKKWFTSRAYLNGLKLVPHDSTDAVEFARQYTGNKEQWDKVFEYLKTTNLDSIAPGRYPIPGTDLFASIGDGPTKDFDKTSWESHKKVIDLQYVIDGAEKFGVAPVSKAIVSIPYDDAKDIVHYETEGPIYTATPGTFFLFFPSDAHRPVIKSEGSNRSKKIVIKIKYIP